MTYWHFDLFLVNPDSGFTGERIKRKWIFNFGENKMIEVTKEQMKFINTAIPKNDVRYYLTSAWYIPAMSSPTSTPILASCNGHRLHFVECYYESDEEKPVVSFKSGKKNGYMIQPGGLEEWGKFPDIKRFWTPPLMDDLTLGFNQKFCEIIRKIGFDINIVYLQEALTYANTRFSYRRASSTLYLSGNNCFAMIMGLRA